MTGSICPPPEPDVRPARSSPPRTASGIEAHRRLQRSGYLALRDISCDVEGGGLRLHGRLPSYYLKQVAQALVAEVEGVDRVVNMIKVSAPPARPPLGHDRLSSPGDARNVRRNLP